MQDRVADFPFPMSSVEDRGVLNCSKWLRHSLLLTMEEMSCLLQEWAPPFFLPTGVISKDAWRIEPQLFLEQYGAYLKHITTSKAFPPMPMRRFFTLYVSSSPEDFYAIPVGQDKVILKPAVPAIQGQLYYGFISEFDGKMYSMTMHPEAFSFGLQFSYPQVYEDPHTHQFYKTMQQEENLFKKLLSWGRVHTKPVLLTRNGVRTPTPLRIGKSAEDVLVQHRAFQQAVAERVLCNTP